MARKDTTEEMLRYTFSPEEKAELSAKLALACQDKTQAEEEKKDAMAGFKGRIDKELANIGHFSRLVNNGWESRTTKCAIEYHMPVNGTKRITRIDTGEVVREVAMSAAEFQEVMQFGDEELAAKRAAERDETKKMEEAVRDFFKATETPSPEPIEVSSITSFRAGGFLLAAADEDAAKAYVAGHEFIKGDVEWCDPDATIFTGLEQTYGDESRTARAAIVRMFEMGRGFPCILAFPPDVVAEPGGPKPDAEEKPSGEAPPTDGKKPRGQRKPKPPAPETPAEPEKPVEPENPLEPQE